ncbi:Nramp family divalent metal transporter [Ammoniphilus sp. 3BR4]|uniref:Nramp family divalent metal transporter n=1 Tax=Ammoniphilus sp. 3BR4 TaxID=3158265 RepID=UPI0034660B76
MEPQLKPQLEYSKEERTEYKAPPQHVLQMIKWIGPGLAVAAAAVGSGEIINATRFGAIAGFAVLWVVFCGVFLKGFIQQEIGRYTLTTKKTITEGFSDIPGPKIKGKSWFLWSFIALLALVVLVIVAGISGAMGGVIHTLFPFWSATTWGNLAMLSVIPMLLAGTLVSRWNVYRIFESIMTVLVVMMTLFMVYVAFIAIPSTGKYSYSLTELLGGMTFSLPSGSTIMALAVLGTVGAGIELVFYSAWLTGKGYLDQAYHPEDSESQQENRMRSWIRILKLDTWVGVFATFIVTLAYFITGASVLKTLGEVPNGVDVVKQISVVFTDVLGPEFYYLFLIGAFAGLLSTALGVADGTARMSTDIINEISGQRRSNNNNKIYSWVVIGVVISWIIFYSMIKAPTLLIMIGGAALSLLFPMYGAALLYLNRQVPKKYQMSTFTKIALAGCFLLFTSLWFVEKLFS